MINILANIPDPAAVLDTAAGRSDATYLAVAVMLFSLVVMFGVGWFFHAERRERKDIADALRKQCAGFNELSDKLSTTLALITDRRQKDFNA